MMARPTVPQSVPRRQLRLIARFLGAGAALAAGPLAAQSYEVVQPVPSPAMGELNAALQRLARNPGDFDALVAAGKASLAVDDLDAASGFFNRAEILRANDPRVKAGLGAVNLKAVRPIEALQFFDRAQAAGATPLSLAADRALAYDLVGDNASAQAQYRLALTAGPNEELSMRLGLSQAIAGDKAAFEATLLPMLQRRSFAAYRARAFGLAILGQETEAVSIAEAVMPRDMAARMTPYLRYMPKLTRAQQAAAANLGSFPRAAQIGRDDPRFAQFVKPAPALPAARGDARLAPAGEPLGPRAKPTAVDRRRARADERRTAQPARTGVSAPSRVAVTPAPSPAPATLDAPVRTARAEPAAIPVAVTPAAQPQRPVTSASRELPPVATSAAPSSAPASLAASAVPPRAELPPVAAVPPSTSQSAAPPVRIVAAAPPSVPVPVRISPPPASSIIAPQPSGAVSSITAAPVTIRPAENGGAAPTTVAAAAVPVLSAQSVASPASSLAIPALAPASPAALSPAVLARVADAFADLADPGAGVSGPADGAVDITRIKPRRESVEPVAAAAPPPPHPPPPKPKVPARTWIQVATGRDVKALAFDWNRLEKKAPALLGKRDGYTAKWGQTRRLVTGPIDSPKAANKLVADLKAAGIDAFVFTSEAGEDVAPLK